ncbi:diacylglycerol/lipid kinase family protein [Mariniflexile jejuense]|uniref:Diacylglycerol/lipid kinase family protein n=1 Tax=Mariniflexile jejuense TaxID=1173582 RepID=A0ABW3JMR8_9FLAO
MKHIHFILNSIAGKGNNNLDLKLINKYFDKSDYHVVIKPTFYKKHAIKLTQASITEEADIVVACGGDGTINEVASCLVSTSIPLGIIPLGSGNGLTSNLNIPKNIESALEIIKNNTIKKIDVGLLNQHYFFSNSGIGFDAQVIKHYEASRKRTLSSYIKATIKSLKKTDILTEVETTFNNTTLLHKPFLIFISNSNQMGYNVSLTPKASLIDGKLDILIAPKLNTLKIALFTILMFFKKHHILKEVEIHQTKEIKITQNNKQLFQIQLDGEFLMIKGNSIQISVLEKAINVIA